jgi:hypothetical protein
MTMKCQGVQVMGAEGYRRGSYLPMLSYTSISPR